MDKIFGVPIWLAEVLFGVCITVGLGALVSNYGDHQFAAGQADTKAKWDAEKVLAQQQAMRDQAANAATSQRRIDDQAKVINEQAKQLAGMASDRDAERAAGQRVRKQLDLYVDSATNQRGASSNPEAGSQCQAAKEAVSVLADMYREIDEFAGQVAEAYDLAQSAGSACERSYDALTSTDSITLANQ